MTGSRTAGYVIGVVLLLPLAFLGLAFVVVPSLSSDTGMVWFVLSVGAVAVGAAIAWVMRRRVTDADGS